MPHGSFSRVSQTSTCGTSRVHRHRASLAGTVAQCMRVCDDLEVFDIKLRLLAWLAHARGLPAFTHCVYPIGKRLLFHVKQSWKQCKDLGVSPAHWNLAWTAPWTRCILTCAVRQILAQCTEARICWMAGMAAFRLRASKCRPDSPTLKGSWSSRATRRAGHFFPDGGLRLRAVSRIERSWRRSMLRHLCIAAAELFCRMRSCRALWVGHNRRVKSPRR